MSRVLVTGGAGFIGSHLCERLLSLGHSVVCVDDLSTGSDANIAHLMDSPMFQFYNVDVRNRVKLHNIFRAEKPNLVYHLAAVVGVKRTLKNPTRVLDVNIGGTLNLLNVAYLTGCQRVVFASSSEVYGTPVEIPERETSPLNAVLPYAVSKLAGEKYMEAFRNDYGLSTVSLRLFNVYGPRQDGSGYGFVVGIFIDRVLSGLPPVVFGDGLQTRDFVYVDDCVAAMVLAGMSSEADGKVVNVASGSQPVTLLNLANRVKAACGREDLSTVFERPREFDIKQRYGDAALMRSVLKFAPRVGLDEGLKRTVNWYQAQRKTTGPLTSGQSCDTVESTP